MNLNELARNIAKAEGKQEPLSIAQIKEVLRCLGDLLVSLSTADALKLLARLVAKRA